MDDVYRPIDFTNIQGFSQPLPNKAVEKLSSFQRNNAISVKTHVRNFNLCVAKWCNGQNQNHEDVKIKFFVLSLEEDALDLLPLKMYRHCDNNSDRGLSPNPQPLRLSCLPTANYGG